jgi:raffinose/stachyose/melibiose transport system permease protein
MLLASLKSTAALFQSPFSLPWPLQWSNYSNAWGQANLLSAFENSLIVAAVSIAVSTVVASWAAFSVVRLRPPFSPALQLFFVVGLLVPAPVLIIPMFLLLKLMHLIGSISALVVPYCGLLIPLAFLVYVHFIRTTPASIGEAAQVDGANAWQVFWKIEFPLLWPATMTVMILNAIFVWNDFLLPLVLGVQENLHTLPVAVVSFFGLYSVAWGLVFASVVISAIPIIVLYALFSRRFFDGVTAGALR